MLPALLRDVAALGHVVFDDGDLNLNLIAQRSPSRVAGELDDLLSVVYRQRGVWREIAWRCSTDPGPSALRAREHPRGTAILAPGQYRSAYEAGKHKGRDALVQVGPVTVRRDRDRDATIEPGKSDTGLFGINIHDDAGVGADASAGCIVLARGDLHDLLGLVDEARRSWGPRLTLTLIEV